MEKLELKHLSPYLPYGLQVKPKYSTTRPTPVIEGIVRNVVYWNYHGSTGSDQIEHLSPILRPLTDLKKEIEYKGDKIIPVDYWDSELKAIEYHDELKSMVENNYCDNYLPYKIQEKLIEWHFDVFGLIDAGLAIDINTLQESVKSS